MENHRCHRVDVLVHYFLPSSGVRQCNVQADNGDLPKLDRVSLLSEFCKNET